MTPEIIAYLQALAQWHADMVAWVLSRSNGVGGYHTADDPGSSPPPPPPPPPKDNGPIGGG